MHLTKLFNFKYLIQNLKKSKGVLAIFLGLIPILNFLIFLAITLNTEGTKILTLSEISGVNMVGAFLIPVILSYCLFGYLFKKKSVDFIGSMPIDRKTIFISNTVGGIALIIIMNILNILLLSVVANIFKGFLLPFGMAFDYFILWTITYVFIFIVANLAIVLSGNMISGIIVTCLVLFLLPFINDYIVIKNDQNNSNLYQVKCTNPECQPESYYCYDEECTENLKNNMYQTYIEKKEKAPSHPAPYSYISNYLLYNYSNYETNFYNSESLIKMIIGSVICFLFGLLSLIKRKMEHCETSFDNIIIHNIVKSLVLVPVFCIMLEILQEENIALIIFIALVIVYYLVYDLITMRKISLKRSAVITFLTMSSIIIFSITCIAYFANKSNEEIIDVSEIESVAITFDNDYLTEEIFIKDKKLINHIMKLETTNYDYKTESEEELNNLISYSFIYNGIKYSSRSWISSNDYNYIINCLSKSQTYIQEITNIDENINVITIDNYVYDDTEEILNIIKKELKNISLKEYINVFDKDYLFFEIKLVNYENHDLTYKVIPAGLSLELQNKVAEVKNNNLINALEKKQNIKNELSIYINNTLYIHEIGSANNDIIVDYLFDYSHNEIIDYIYEHKNAKIDLSKEYVYLDVYFNNNKYNYVTNDIKGIKKILLDKHQQLLKTNEYNDLLNNKESDVEYYD